MKKWRRYALIGMVIVGFFVFWDYVDYNTAINEVSVIFEIPEAELKAVYPYIPFEGLMHSSGRHYVPYRWLH